jgi:20S proteasome alpha/beta subunit
MEVFEDNYKEGMTQAQAIALGLKALAAANEHKLKSEIIEIGVVSAKQDFGLEFVLISCRQRLQA